MGIDKIKLKTKADKEKLWEGEFEHKPFVGRTEEDILQQKIMEML